MIKYLSVDEIFTTRANRRLRIFTFFNIFIEHKMNEEAFLPFKLRNYLLLQELFLSY